MELVCTKNVFYPILLFPLLSHPKLLPLWSVPDRQRNLNTPLSLTSFFFPLSARGPTRRSNSTGLAELWGGWPIEQADRACGSSSQGRLSKSITRRTPRRADHPPTPVYPLGHFVSFSLGLISRISFFRKVYLPVQYGVPDFQI